MTTTSSLTEGPFRPLHETFSGDLMEPGDPRWDAATQAYNLTVDQRPDLVAFPATVDDVIAAVEFARDRGMQVAAQRTGHSAEPLGAMDNVILVKTDALRGVEIDAARRVARVSAGSKWEDVVPPASDLGLAALHGSTPDVSVAGYSLGGGIGWYARKLGLSSNSIAAIEVVTADGRLRRVDHDNDPELFWALRGGGGNFGIVTALEIELHAIPEIYAGAMFFPWERSAEVLHAWREWIRTVPDELTSVGRVLQFPPIPEVPEPFRGKQFALIEAVFIGDQRTGAELLDPLRALGPAMDTFAMVPPAGIAELHMDPPEPVPYTGGSHLLDDLPASAIDAFVELVGPGSGSPLVSAEIRHLGGALSRSEARHGALGTVDAAFMAFGVGMVMSPESHTAIRERLALLAGAFAAHDTGRSYLNFCEQSIDSALFYSAESYGRLRAAKAAFDPQNVIRANHPIAGA